MLVFFIGWSPFSATRQQKHQSVLNSQSVFYSSINKMYNGSTADCFSECTVSDSVNCARRRDELRLLYEVSIILSEMQNVESVFKSLLEKMASCIGIVRGAIAILNRVTGAIDIAEGYGLDREQLKKGCYLPGEGVTGNVVNTGNPIAIPRISEEPLFLNRTGARNMKEAHNTSFICVPIRLDIEVIGTISIDLPYSPDVLDDKVRLLTIVAASIAQFVRIYQISIEEVNELKAENSRLQAELQEQCKKFTSIGKSEGMRRIHRQMITVCNTKATVLLLGETGVGKERFANDIHYASSRAKMPFIKVNCAAIPETLIESVLFGHEKGSFTGAVQQQKGYFEQANGGTIFLDEIGELPLMLQAKFLRILQERTFERIGGSETIHVDVRVIAATNSDLKKLVDDGTFRQDLYYRLSVFPIVIPPLRERKIDIMLLADHFAKRFSEEYGKSTPSFSVSTTNILNCYTWPGNIRELENTIERAVILSNDGVIHSYHLPEEMQNIPGMIPRRIGTLPEVLESIEKEMIVDELKRSRGNMAKAAKNLGITERIMGLRIAKYHLKPKGEK
ncbi:MAG: sigma 54-interacting transcriptional regulator [Planctomycetaceae bacterium]|jgi:Nif-specific regulatory protein|nr:sigma 54-interacting transcriptional regulator [Planctomycetaceae bacterium]